VTGTEQQRAARRVRQTCIALRLRLVSRVITRIYDEALRPFGLRVPQFAMLALAEERGLLRQVDVCRELQLDNSTLSRNLERMRAKGWLEDAPSGSPRERPHRITSKGRQLLKRSLPAWSEAQEEARRRLGSLDALLSFGERLGLPA